MEPGAPVADDFWPNETNPTDVPRRHELPVRGDEEPLHRAPPAINDTIAAPVVEPMDVLPPVAAAAAEPAELAVQPLALPPQGELLVAVGGTALNISNSSAPQISFAQYAYSLVVEGVSEMISFLLFLVEGLLEWLHQSAVWAWDQIVQDEDWLGVRLLLVLLALLTIACFMVYMRYRRHFAAVLNSPRYIEMDVLLPPKRKLRSKPVDTSPPRDGPNSSGRDTEEENSIMT